MLKPAVFTLRVLSDDGKVNIGMAGLVSGKAFHEGDTSIQAQFLADFHVQGSMKGARDRRINNSLEKSTLGLDKGSDYL